MSQEPFPPLRVWDEALKAHRNYQVIKCGECDAFENMPINGKNAMPPEMIVKRMQQRGWVMGHRRRHDLCPVCANKKASKNKVTQITDYLAAAAATNNEPKEQPMQNEMPRTPSRDEKRLIVLAIEDHYNDQTRGYENGWSDEKIAADLNVPRKWVSDLREEFYGPVIDPEIAELDRKVKELEAAFSAAASHLSDLRDKLNDVKARLAKKIAA